jgi:hypothetical protein
MSPLTTERRFGFMTPRIVLTFAVESAAVGHLRAVF